MGSYGAGHIRADRIEVLGDGDVADVGAEEEDVGRVGELDVVVPEVV